VIPVKITSEEKTALVLLTIFLLAASLVLYVKDTSFRAGIAVRKADLAEELTLAQVEERIRKARIMDINKADAGQLQVVPGIGEVLAGRIVSYRDEMGGFTSVEELLDVEGIGPAKLERIREYIKVE